MMSMTTAAPKTPTPTKTVIARVPYLNSVPFFHGLHLDPSWELIDASPRQIGLQAEGGNVLVAPMALVDYLRLKDQYERLGNLGIAVRGRCGSVLLLGKKPIRQLADATIQVTDESSTSAVLLRLLLEQRYLLRPQAYQRGRIDDADAVLAIGDEALRMRAHNRMFSFEYDLAFEWWLWQHLPAVFAVWVVRKDASSTEKQQILRALQRQLAVNLSRLGDLAKGRAESLDVPAAELQAYLENFVYRLSDPEEQAIARFEQLVHAYHLL